MMLMHTSDDEASAQRLYNRVIRGRHLDGIVITSSVVDDPVVMQLQQTDFPFVLIGRHPRYEEISFVDVDNRGAAREAVAHLLCHGYRRIAIIGGMPNMIAAIDRNAGYVTALQEAGLLPDPALSMSGEFTQEGAYRATMALLPHQPDAIFATSDTMATGALRALRDAGLRVPGGYRGDGLRRHAAGRTDPTPALEHCRSRSRTSDARPCACCLI